MLTLTTVDAVIDAVGGTAAAAVLTARKPQHVSNWRKEKRIASATYLQFKEELNKRKLRASPVLWGIAVPKKPRKKTAS